MADFILIWTSTTGLILGFSQSKPSLTLTFWKCSPHGLLLGELAQYEGDTSHIKDYSTDVMLGRLNQNLQVSLLTPQSSFEFSPKKSQENTILAKQERLGSYLISYLSFGTIAEAVLETKAVRCSFCDSTLRVPSPPRRAPPAGGGCVARRKC